MMAEPVWATTFKGLNAVLDNDKIGVAKACQAVEECIASNRDNLRGFFEQCFPPLVARIFGYTGASWLSMVARSNKEADARALLRLLSPSGPLFTAIHSADADGTTRFLFPRERLPAHTQMMLATAAGRQVVAAWPQYARTIVADAAGNVRIQVGVFQYFCYWFAFYAIRGSDGGGGDVALRSAAAAAAGFGVSVRRAADALHLTRGRDADPASRHPYLAVLRQLLLEMLPRPAGAGAAAAAAAAAASPSRAATLRSSGGKQRPGDAATRGLLFYSTLCEFWLTDPDEPVPVDTAASAAERGRGMVAAAPMSPLWATTYEPPSEDSLEALAEVIRYVTTVSGSGGGAEPAQAGPPWLPPTPTLAILTAVQQGRRDSGGGGALSGPPQLGAGAQPGAQALSRQLYRFFHRALTMWPDQRSMKPLLRALLAYLAPWQAAAVAAPAVAAPAAAAAAAAAPAPGSTVPAALASTITTRAAGLAHRVHWLDSPRARGDGSGGRYGPEWEAHVLCNLPAYLRLVPLFLELSLSRVAVRGESAVQDVVAVMGVLERAPLLAELLQRAERDFNRCLASAPRRAEGPYAEALPWLLEQAHDWQVAASANAVGDTPAMRAAPPYALFSTAEGGAAPYVVRELLELSAGVLKPEAQARVKRCLEAVVPVGELPAHAAGAAGAAAAGAAALDEGVPRLPRSSWQDVRYKGDALHRPVATYELRVLVRVLVALSTGINTWVGLDRPWLEGEEPPENRAQQVVARLRRARWRVNLRPLADVRLLAWIPVAWLAGHLLLRLLRLVWWALAVAPGEQALAADDAHVAYRRLKDEEWDVLLGRPPAAEA